MAGISASFAIIMFPHARVAARRISEVMDAEGTADLIPDEDLHFTGKIDFEDATFRYQGADQAALSHITLHINPGDKISVIGGTGSGKSTIVSLLLSFRQPTEGRVLFDGRDAKTISRKTIRRNISCALQKSMIYSGTVRENVQMGRMDATEDELREVLHLAAADFVYDLENGLDTVCAEIGAGLSEGQAQRIAIARALLRPGGILVLDEATSALDADTELELLERLGARYRGTKTILCITHRPAATSYADGVLKLG